MQTLTNSSSIPLIPRFLDLSALLRKKSYFLFGPRQTGKTFLIRQNLQNARVYNLLDQSLFLSLSRNLSLIRQQTANEKSWIVVDEIQRLPDLLNEIQLMIEEQGKRFLLTGSSARKLRKGGVNLLGGRLRTQHLHPFSFWELKEHFNLNHALNRGLIPSIYFSDDVEADLQSYAGTYLQQEIIAEGATRNAPAFSRFLRVAALSSGTVINFTTVANEAQVPRTTLYEYFEILKDTLVLHELPAWKESVKRKPIVSSKYYFFDTGVTRILQGRPKYVQGTAEFGQAFEAFIFHELTAYRDYQFYQPLYFWRSIAKHEVDFIIGGHTAVEVKAKTNIVSQDLNSLTALGEEAKMKRLLCVCLEPKRRKVGHIEILPYQEFLQALWSGQYRK